jgi:preprotein translocase subunit SecF
MTLQFDTDIQESALREALTTAGYQEATIQYSPSSKEYFVSIRATTTAEWDQLQSDLQASFNNTLHVLDHQFTDKGQAATTAKAAILAVVVAG